MLSHDDVDKAYDELINKIHTIYDDFCPVQNIKINDTESAKPWLSNGLSNAIKTPSHMVGIF